MGRSPQRPRILLLRKLVSFSGCPPATHMRNSSSNLTGINLSVWEEKIMFFYCSNGKRNYSVKSSHKIFCLSLSLLFFFSLRFAVLSSNVHILYQVKHQRLFVVSSHAWKVGFDLGFYIALVASNEADSSYSLRQITGMPCLHSQLCYFAKHTENTSAELLQDERTRTHSQFESHEFPQLPQLHSRF